MNKGIFRTTRRCAVLAVAALILGPLSGAKAAWPEKPIKIVLPFGAGGVADVLGERNQVHRMRIVSRIGRRKIPFGLRRCRNDRCGSGKRRDAGGKSARLDKPEHHNTFL